jgi:hypothetical protein
MAPRLWRAALLAVVGAVAVSSAACSTSGYTYVKNSGEGAYFKVPDSWQLYKLDPNALPDDRPFPDGANQLKGPWRIVFDADPKPSVSHFQEDVPQSVVGQASISTISQGSRDQVSNVDLRALALDSTADPIALYQQGNTDIEIVKYEALTTRDGFRGNRIVLNKLINGSYVTIDQIALVDPGTTTLYRFLVKCASKCYLQHRNEIDTVVDSWQIRKKS